MLIDIIDDFKSIQQHVIGELDESLQEHIRRFGKDLLHIVSGQFLSYVLKIVKRSAMLHNVSDIQDPYHCFKGTLGRA